jgi:xanthine dehydrogenase accessory factor
MTGPPFRPEDTVLVRGGGDLATGIVWRLSRLGWPVVVTELERPLTVRRTVSLSTAVTDGEIQIEGLIGRRCPADPGAVDRMVADGVVPVVVSPELPGFRYWAVVDARMAKHNIDTGIDDAVAVVGIGPGFTVGIDCHAVIETQRGHRLGRVLWEGSAAANTGTPGLVGGRGRERVLRAPVDGVVEWRVGIGDLVESGQALGRVNDEPIDAPFEGVVRGLILGGSTVPAGLKIGDVDPRPDPSMCHQISDKALAIGGGAVEALACLSP